MGPGNCVFDHNYLGQHWIHRLFTLIIVYLDKIGKWHSGLARCLRSEVVRFDSPIFMRSNCWV